MPCDFRAENLPWKYLKFPVAILRKQAARVERRRERVETMYLFFDQLRFFFIQPVYTAREAFHNTLEVVDTPRELHN